MLWVTDFFLTAILVSVQDVTCLGLLRGLSETSGGFGTVRIVHVVDDSYCPWHSDAETSPFLGRRQCRVVGTHRVPGGLGFTTTVRVAATVVR